MTRLSLLRLCYRILTASLLPLLLLRLWLKGFHSADYRKRWLERLGIFKVEPWQQAGICFHCVSVGETVAAIPLIRLIQQQTDLPITVTTTTPTGSAQVRASLGNSVFHTYLPFDSYGCIRRFFHRLQPKLLVIMETELWPNLLHLADQYQCRTLLANARLSERSAKGYRNKLTTLSADMMRKISHVASHDRLDGQRFIDLGLAANKLSVTGSIKFDLNTGEQVITKAQQLQQQLQLPKQRPIWVVGSTHQGEEEQILRAFKQVLAEYPQLLMILVPRHPERFAPVAQLIEQHKFTMQRRSSNQGISSDCQVLLGDSMGELMQFWSMATIAFVGGSLIERGGHNPLEPAAFAVPVISGCQVFNFTHIYQLLSQQDAVQLVENSDQLAQQIRTLLQQPDQAAQQGLRGQRVVNQNRGATDKLKQIIIQLLATQ